MHPPRHRRPSLRRPGWPIARRRVPAVVPAVALAVLLAACRDTGEGDPTPDAAPTTTAPTEITTTTAATTSAAPSLTVTGPVPGTPQTTAGAGLDAEGYVEEEYFVGGTAASFRPDGELGDDGRWSLTKTDEAEFATRILVRRPVDTAEASGVVLVEWNNVSAGFDSTPDWTYAGAEIMRAGHIHVGVSAQEAGVDGADDGGIAGGFGSPLTTADPERYGSLDHPGDEYSYDLFSQIGRLVRSGPTDGPDPLGDLPRDHVLAVGESQSAFRLTSYINGVQPLDEVFDGFLVHSRGGGAAPFDDDDGLTSSIDGEVRIRDDVDVPVLVFTTETDLTVLGYASARQSDAERFRNWEVAGTAHADAFLLGGDPVAAAGALGCPLPVNDGPQYVALRAAVSALVDWVVDDAAPPSGEAIELTADGGIERDADGNALGGIRLPAVEIPVATLSGEPSGDSTICRLFGSTTPFSAEQLASRYGSTEEYLDAVDLAYDDAVAAGFALEADRAGVLAEASDVTIG